MNQKKADGEPAIQERSVLAVLHRGTGYTIREIYIARLKRTSLAIEYAFSGELLEYIREIWELLDTDYQPRIIDHAYNDSRIVVYFGAEQCMQASQVGSRFIGRLASLQTKYRELGFEIRKDAPVFVTETGQSVIPTIYVERSANPTISLNWYREMQGRAAKLLTANVGLSLQHQFDEELAACISWHRACEFDRCVGIAVENEQSGRELMVGVLNGVSDPPEQLLVYLEQAIE